MYSIASRNKTFAHVLQFSTVYNSTLIHMNISNEPVSQSGVIQYFAGLVQSQFDLLCVYVLQAHNFALDDHKRITMDEYEKEYRKVEIRRCETHTDQAYSVACNKCNQVFCATCVTVNPGKCTDGMLSNI